MGTNPIGLLGSGSHPNPTTYSSSSRGAAAAARAMAGQFSWPAAREGWRRREGAALPPALALGAENEKEKKREREG